MELPLNPEKLHHAYVITGISSVVSPMVTTFFTEQLAFPIVGNPDFFYEKYKTLTIDVVRNLRQIQLKKPVVYAHKIFFICIEEATIEAQNAFLKVLEEPVGHTIFFINAPHASLFIPTVMSRVLHIDMRNVGEEEQKDAQEFLKSSFKERLEIISNFVDSKDKEGLAQLLTGLEYIFHQKLKDTGNNPTCVFSLKTILEMKTLLRRKGSSLKLIGEHCALAL